MPVIGVFDSGFGGLTVLRALLPLIPNAHYIYLGDTARLPYGAKSQTTIARFAVESARFLEAQGCDHLVIACNTATALALPEITAAASIPVTGVVEPGAQSAYASLAQRELYTGPQQDPADRLDLREREVLVLATSATVSSHAYYDACARLGLRAVEKATPLLVPLVEEGWVQHPVTNEVLRIYLTEAIGDGNPNAVLLGCTHYPLIREAIEATLRSLGLNIPIIDSAQSTALTVAHAFNAPLGLGKFTPPTDPATFLCYATDSTEKFRRLGSTFLGQQIHSVQLLDLGG
ncbi:MAG: glutamate racemase [Acidobacteriota bacterium]